MDDFNKIILVLKKYRHQDDEKDHVILLLSSFPKTYEHFVDTMLYGKESLTMTKVKSAFISNELQRKHETKKKIEW